MATAEFSRFAGILNVSVRGSGIGLAVVDEIIRLHDGKLDIASTPGRGTVVTIILPTDKTLDI